MSIPQTKLEDISDISEEITESDISRFKKISSIQLNDAQKKRILEPPNVYPEQEQVMAVHWHPEFIPVPLIKERIEKLFPNRQNELIIPTQHNIITSYNEHAGVEIDCCSKEFNLKVQLLVHFHISKLEKTSALESMLSHTFKYRSSQLFQFMDAILNPKKEHILQEAAKKTGMDKPLVNFVKVYAKKLDTLIKENRANIPQEMIRNKIIQNFFETLHDKYNEQIVFRATNFLKRVKEIVKKQFSLEYFYETHEIIEEVRAIGGGIIIPHPEQFWPILLADYDVDGYEVWNPQSREFTEFLIHVVIRGNKYKKFGDKPLLITMGDDCHMGEKVKSPEHQNVEKASREIGVQTVWDDLAITKILDKANINREKAIEEYKSRLHG